jgi:hypothetical protein
VGVELAAALLMAAPPPEPRLLPLLPPAIGTCQRMQANVPFAVLCPARVPRATRGWRAGDRPPPLRIDVFGSPGRPHLQTPYGVDFGYGAPVEPQSGRGWRKLLWHNRPCCFLHFTLFRPRGAELPLDLKPATLGGRRGLIRYATGYGLKRTLGYWWSNHTWFFWHEHGIRYTASLHYFGAGTTRLLGRLIAELQPANELKPHRPLFVQPATFTRLPRGWRAFQDVAGLLTRSGADVNSYALSWAYKPNPYGWANQMPRNAIAVNAILSRRSPGTSHTNLCWKTPHLPGFPRIGRLPLRLPQTTSHRQEGQPNIPEYRIFGRIDESYNVDLRVDINNPHPTAAMLRRAETVVSHIRFPAWPRLRRC